MSLHRIYIFTQRVHSGKTTILQQWLRDKKFEAAGILTPDKDGKRKLYDIVNDTYHELEMDENYPAEKTLTVGKYRFSKKGFEKAQEILLDAVEKDPEWLIVDEVGKLELEDNTGLEPALSQVVDAYRDGQTKGKLILVVRSNLLDEAVKRYGLSTDMVLHKSFFE